jgi:hypothetical protein
VSAMAYQTTAHETTIDLTTLSKCSPVAGKPWCIEGEAHPNRWHRADQGGRSEIHEVTLAAWGKVQVSERGEPMPSKLGGRSLGGR